MKTSGIFRLHRYKIKLPKSTDEFYIVPFGDIHFLAKGHCSSAWQKFEKWMKKTPNAFALGMGDYSDFSSATDRAIITKTTRDSTREIIDEMCRESTAQIAQSLSWLQEPTEYAPNGRLIGLLGGNHNMLLMDGIDTDMLLAQMLHTEYLGVMVLIRVSIEASGGHCCSFDMLAHHGQGAARLVGGSLNRVQQMAESWDADIYLMGHDHKMPTGHTNRLSCVHNSKTCALELKERRVDFVRTGGFQRAFVDGASNHIVDKAGGALVLGTPKIRFVAGRVSVDGKRVMQLDREVIV